MTSHNLLPQVSICLTVLQSMPTASLASVRWNRWKNLSSILQEAPSQVRIGKDDNFLINPALLPLEPGCYLHDCWQAREGRGHKQVKMPQSFPTIFLTAFSLVQHSLGYSKAQMFFQSSGKVGSNSLCLFFYASVE